MASPRKGESEPPRARGRKMDALGQKLMKGVDQSPESELRQAEEVLRWSIRKHGADSAFSVRAMIDVADQLARQGRLADEVGVRGQIVIVLRSSLGLENDSTVSAELKLAICLLDVHQAESAEHLLTHVVAARALKLGSDDPATLSAIAWRANAVSQLGNFKDARALQEQVLSGLALKGAEVSPQAQTAALNLASTLVELGDFDEASQLVRQVLERRSTSLGPEDSSTLDALQMLASIERKQLPT